MPNKSDELFPLLGENQIQQIFRELSERLHISVDFNSLAIEGLQFWTELESDLKRSLEIDSIQDIEQGRRKMMSVLGKLVADQQLHLSEQRMGSLLDQIMDHYFGLGILDALLTDDSIYRILINGFQEIYFEKRGKLQRSLPTFWSDAHLKHVIDRFCLRHNAALPSEKNSVIRLTLPDNSLVILLSPPVTPSSLTLSINRLVKKAITIDQLIKYGSISAEILQFLKGSVEAGLNMIVCGHMGSGASTLVGILASFIPGDERVISIERGNSYSLKINHLVSLIADDTLPGGCSYAKLLTVAGDLRGDRLVLGELSSPDTYAALQAVNDNFAGSIIRVVAKSPVDAVDRLETFMQLDTPALSRAKINSLIGSSIDLIVYQERLRDGSRVVKNVVEVLDDVDENDQVILKNVFDVEQMGMKDGRIVRKFRCYGPPSETLMQKIAAAGIELSPAIFATDVSAERAPRLSEKEKRAIKFSKGKYAFVSYSKKDRELVRALMKRLEKAGFDLWMDVLDIQPGDEWTKILEGAIKNAGAFLVMMTPSSVKAPFVRNEIILAQDEKIPIIPVKIAECDVPIQIRALQYIQHDGRNTSATVNLISESLSKFISNKQLLGDL